MSSITTTFAANGPDSTVDLNGYIKSSLICADYDGVIQLWDIASASDVMQFDEHTRRVWSVDFSQVGLQKLLQHVQQIPSGIGELSR